MPMPMPSQLLKCSNPDNEMKKLIFFSLALLGASIMTSCLKDDSDPYEEWRNTNNTWLDQQMSLKNHDGSPYYEKVGAVWNPNAYVLMHWHNDRSLTAKNLVPLSTSTVDIKYHLRDCQGAPKDSSYLRATPADSIFRSRVNESIEGWVIGVTNMHVNDSVTMIVPYQYGYGAAQRGSILPYSVLVFDLKLKGIPGYEVPVN